MLANLSKVKISFLTPRYANSSPTLDCKVEVERDLVVMSIQSISNKKPLVTFENALEPVTKKKIRREFTFALIFEFQPYRHISIRRSNIIQENNSVRRQNRKSCNYLTELVLL